MAVIVTKRVIQERTARSTGTVVQIVDNRDGFFDEDDENGWFNVCIDHGNIVSHRSLDLARRFASCPEEWCPDCQDAEEGR